MKLDNLLYHEHGSKTWWQVLKRYIKQKGNSKSTFPVTKNNGILHESDDDNYFLNQATVHKPNKYVPMIQNNTR